MRVCTLFSCLRPYLRLLLGQAPCLPAWRPPPAWLCIFPLPMPFLVFVLRSDSLRLLTCVAVQRLPVRLLGRLYCRCHFWSLFCVAIRWVFLPALLCNVFLCVCLDVFIFAPAGASFTYVWYFQFVSYNLCPDAPCCVRRFLSYGLSWNKACTLGKYYSYTELYFHVFLIYICVQAYICCVMFLQWL